MPTVRDAHCGAGAPKGQSTRCPRHLHRCHVLLQGQYELPPNVARPLAAASGKLDHFTSGDCQQCL